MLLYFRIEQIVYQLIRLVVSDSFKNSFYPTPLFFLDQYFAVNEAAAHWTSIPFPWTLPLGIHSRSGIFPSSDFDSMVRLPRCRSPSQIKLLRTGCSNPIDSRTERAELSPYLLPATLRRAAPSTRAAGHHVPTPSRVHVWKQPWNLGNFPA